MEWVARSLVQTLCIFILNTELLPVPFESDYDNEYEVETSHYPFCDLGSCLHGFWWHKKLESNGCGLCWFWGVSIMLSKAERHSSYMCMHQNAIWRFLQTSLPSKWCQTQRIKLDSRGVTGPGWLVTLDAGSRAAGMRHDLCFFVFFGLMDNHRSTPANINLRPSTTLMILVWRKTKIFRSSVLSPSW